MISFCATLKENPSLRKNLKQTNVDELVSSTKKFIDTKFMQTVLGDDVIELKGKKYKYGDYVIMNCGNSKKNIDIDIQTRGEVKSSSLIQQLIVYSCTKYDVPCYLHGKKNIERTFKRLLEKATANNEI